jgi:hypothetical protein
VATRFVRDTNAAVAELVSHGHTRDLDSYAQVRREL